MGAGTKPGFESNGEVAAGNIAWVETEDGKEALEKLAGDSLSVVATDLYVPQASGLDLLVAMEKSRMFTTTTLLPAWWFKIVGM